MQSNLRIVLPAIDLELLRSFWESLDQHANKTRSDCSVQLTPARAIPSINQMYYIL